MKIKTDEGEWTIAKEGYIMIGKDREIVTLNNGNKKIANGTLILEGGTMLVEGNGTGVKGKGTRKQW